MLPPVTSWGEKLYNGCAVGERVSRVRECEAGLTIHGEKP